MSLNGPCCPVKDCKSSPVWENQVDLSDPYPGFIDVQQFCLNDEIDCNDNPLNEILIYRIPTAIETSDAREKQVPLEERMLHFSTH